MLNRLAVVLIASVLSSASAALAQTQPSPAAAQKTAAQKDAETTTVAPITVEAAPKPKVVERQTYNFVQDHAGAAINPLVDQLARWDDPICIQTVGLVADQNAAVQARVADVAKSVGLHMGKAGCRANIEIVFTAQPQGLMDVVYKRRENILGYYHRHDGVRLKTVTHPIQAWYVTATRGGGGDTAGAVFFTGSAQVEDEVIDDPDNPVPGGCGQSPHFTHCLQSKLHNVFMVADSKALEGKDLGLVADYMVMLALSQPKSLDSCGALPSVIDLFAKSGCPGRDEPDGLTPADAAYLTALYSTDLEATKWGEQSDMARRMAKIIIKATTGK